VSDQASGCVASAISGGCAAFAKRGGVVALASAATLHASVHVGAARRAHWALWPLGLEGALGRALGARGLERQQEDLRGELLLSVTLEAFSCGLARSLTLP